MAEQKANVDLNLQKNKIIDPRLNPKTTAERLAMSPTSNDEGLTVWDSDLNAFFSWDAPTLTWIPTLAKEVYLLPTPKVYVPTNGWQNQASGSNPNDILALDPNNANKKLFLKLYYEGNDSLQNWMSLPNLHFEMVRLKNYQSKGTNNTSVQKKRTGHVWARPSHRNGTNKTGTNYSGGNQYDFNGILLPNRDTNWNVNTQSNKGATQVVGNNPYTDIEIDPKLWFYNPQNGTPSYSNNILPTRYLEYIDNDVRVSGYKGRNRFHGIQTFKFGFIMVASDPTSWNAAKNRYDKEICSEYSEKFEIYPHGGNFDYGGGDIEHVLYEWRIRPL